MAAGSSGRLLEAFKMSVYIAVPLIVVGVTAFTPENLEVRMISKKKEEEFMEVCAYSFIIQ